MANNQMTAICPKCNREIVAYVPRGGDGSAVRLYRHRLPSSLSRFGKREWCLSQRELIERSKVTGDW